MVLMIGKALKTQKRRKKGPVWAALCWAILLCSCSTGINAVLRSGGSGEVTVRSSLGGRTAALIRSLKALAGERGEGGPLLDGPALARSLAAAPGIARTSFENTGPASVEGTVSVSQIRELLNAPGNRERPFVTWEESAAAGSLALSVDRGSAPAIIALISPEAAAYLEALMAPAVTGEILSRGEYLSLVGSIYGLPLADEIAAARIRLTLDFPRPLRRVRGGTASGSRAEFDLPLLDFLVLETPLVYEAAW